MNSLYKYLLTAFVIVLAALVAGCEHITPDEDMRSDQIKKDDLFQDWSKRETIFGKGGIQFFSSKETDEGGALGENSFCGAPPLIPLFLCL